MNGLELKNVTYTYPNGFTALENINMSFEKGESAAIIGQNGAGKTTAVKLMNGLLRHIDGEIDVADGNTKNNTTAPLSNRLGYVLQNPDDQIFHSTVYDEIEFGAKNLKLPEQKVNE